MVVRGQKESRVRNTWVQILPLPFTHMLSWVSDLFYELQLIYKNRDNDNGFTELWWILNEIFMQMPSIVSGTL